MRPQLSLVRSAAVAGLVAFGAAASAGSARAQRPGPTTTLRGAVVAAEDGARVPFAVVMLEPGFGRRFSDGDGRFFFAGAPPGTVRLSVRQVGYSPFDTTITLTAATPPLRVELRRIAVSLTAVTVTASGPCTNPGVPDRSRDPQLAEVFAQLRQNAERFRLLADQYPFRYRMAREFAVEEASGARRATTDTLTLLSSARWPYAPGRVVTPDPDIADSRIVHLPVLADLADSVFHATHCFRLAGLESFVDDGPLLVRLDFRAAESLRDPDVDGSAWLDPDTYQLRHVRVSLTRLARAARGVREWTATTGFREVVANVAVPTSISAVTAYDARRYAGRGRADVGRTEDQRLIGVEFLRTPPAASRDSAP